MNLNTSLQVEKKVGKFLILNEILGEGAQAICKKAVLESDLGQVFAVKIINKNTLRPENRNAKKIQERLQEEIKVLQTVKGVHIVKYIDICESANNIYIFLEYCNLTSQGSLDQIIKKKGGYLSELQTIQFFRQLKTAFQELYSKKIVHRDIKPQNILLHNGNIKLADFGFAKTIDDMNIGTPMTLLGTPAYIPQLFVFMLNQQIVKYYFSNLIHLNVMYIPQV